MNIRSTDFVLEVGSGHNPKSRSNVLCDKYIESDTERMGKICKDSRPLVAADAQALPFADQSFDYVICSQVLEHVEDPAGLARELQRVAPRGYIETPTEIGERLCGWPYHKWYINLVDGRLVLSPKDGPSQFGQLFHALFAHDPDFARFHYNHPHLLLVQHEWEGEIPLEIVPPGTRVVDLESPEVVEAMIRQRAGMKQRLLVPLKASIPLSWRVFIKSHLSRQRQNKARPLEEIVICPACRGDVTWEKVEILCRSCGRRYPIRNGIPHLLV